MRPVSFALSGLLALVSVWGCGKKRAPRGVSTAGGVDAEPGPDAAPASVATVDLETSLAAEDPSTGAGPKHRFRLVVTLAGQPPRNTDLGEYQGTCSKQDDPTAVLSLRCSWAGGGDTLRIARQGDALVVTDTPADEGEPLAKEIARVELPPGTELEGAPGRR